MAEIKETDDFQPIRIIGEDEIIVLPSNDSKIDALCGVSAKPLCRISFRLSCHPPNEWKQFFINAWRNSSFHTSANWYRSDIVSIGGDKVILNKVTEEEVKKYHSKTLDKVAEEANRQYQIFKRQT
ncbi:MAG: hypothetical protein WC454_06500 [Phycisphaerae bacterium]|jgi:hypothetical protein